MPQAHVQLTKEDAAAAGRLHFLVAMRSWKMVAYVFVGALILGLVNRTPIVPTLLGAIFAVVVLLVATRLPWSGRIVGALAGRRIASNKLAIAPQDVVWSDQGIDYTTPFGRSRFTWSDFVQWIEQDGLFMLYPHKQGYQIIPRRAFADRGEIEDLRGYLAEAGVARVGPRRARAKANRKLDAGEVF